MPKRIRPRLGQHFLAAPRYQRRIAQSLALGPDELVIEIGAGRGAMTGLLAERARRVVAIELDARWAEELRDRFAGEPRIEVIRADILATDLARLCRERGAERCFVFGNLPYYITSPILTHLFDFRASIRAMSLLVQREVAARLTAEPGSRDYGFLSVATQLQSAPRLVFSVPPGAFAPPPKVWSALVEFEMKPKFSEWSAERTARFLEFTRRCFARKRQTLVNNLGAAHGRAAVEKILGGGGLSAKTRAEELSVEQLAGLFESLEPLSS
jgi:16S rRNA (adenine1518-N6/adenine1519-N6)-dimethyltransferase